MAAQCLFRLAGRFGLRRLDAAFLGVDCPADPCQVCEYPPKGRHTRAGERARMRSDPPHAQPGQAPPNGVG